MSKKNSNMKAEDLADLIEEQRLKRNQRNYENFKHKCQQAVSKMAADLENDVSVDVTDDDMSALNKVTEELRDLGYKFRFIEKKDGQYELLISIAHLIGPYL